MASYDDDAFDTESYSINAWDIVKKFVDGAWNATVSFKLNVTTAFKTRLGIK